MRSKPQALVLVLVVAVAGCAAVCDCSDAGAPAADGSAMTDASSATRDAGSHDAAARRQDAGRDAGEDPVWRRLEGLEECALEVARDPRAVVEPLEVTTCDERPGCRRLLLPWRRARPIQQLSTSRDAEGHHILIGVGDPELHDLILVVRDEGEPLMVLRKPKAGTFPCDAGFAGIGEGRVVIALYQAAGPDVRVVIATAEIGQPETARILGGLPQSALISSNFVQDLAVSREVIAAHVVPRHAVFRIENDGTYREISSARLSGDGAQAYVEGVRGDTIIVSRLGAAHRIELHTASDARTLPLAREASVPGTDGDRLVWMELEGRQTPLDFDHGELRIAPWPGGGELQARTVARWTDVTLAANPTLGAEHVITYRTQLADFEVHRLEDGARALFETPSGTFLVAGWPEEFVMATRGTSGEYPGVGFIDITRYDSLVYE